ncbi:hypothetical protein AXF42_Ash019607 [Apostasia shenzhenica]|uniref:Uncharacterized protein n=1 Tax=Apostasia shenzhenica TaxID=1088818 RepID=A0A2I0A3I4_9ASPA|nr:hypothetical protein AXF42_Ash019607 [Apostasia shenzhenica]
MERARKRVLELRWISGSSSDGFHATLYADLSLVVMDHSDPELPSPSPHSPSVPLLSSSWPDDGLRRLL